VVRNRLVGVFDPEPVHGWFCLTYANYLVIEMARARIGGPLFKALTI
jgi:hypothetical protein